MEIPQHMLEEFKRLYKKEYGEDLSDREAREIAQRLIGLVLLVSREKAKRERNLEQFNSKNKVEEATLNSSFS